MSWLVVWPVCFLDLITGTLAFYEYMMVCSCMCVCVHMCESAPSLVHLCQIRVTVC